MATGNIKEPDSMFSFDGFFQEPEDEGDESGMTLIDHLEELRWRILKSLIAVAVCTIVAFIFWKDIIHFLAAPLPSRADLLTHGKPVVTGITDGFMVPLQISLVAGVIASLPVLLYQTWAFISPGLYEKEKKYAVPFIVVGVLLFATGVSIGYVVLRFPVEWLVTFGADTFTELISASSYFSFVSLFILVFGTVFELPLVLTFLALVETLRKKRAVAHVGMWFAATIATPGADIYSPVIVGASLSILYELSILFISIVVKKKAVEA